MAPARLLDFLPLGGVAFSTSAGLPECRAWGGAGGLVRGSQWHPLSPEYPRVSADIYGKVSVGAVPLPSPPFPHTSQLAGQTEQLEHSCSGPLPGAYWDPLGKGRGAVSSLGTLQAGREQARAPPPSELGVRIIEMLEGRSREGARRDVTVLPRYRVGRSSVLGALRLVPHHGAPGIWEVLRGGSGWGRC